MPNVCSANASDAKCDHSAQQDADAVIATMTDHPVLIHVPVNTGATGINELRRFYAEIFIPHRWPSVMTALLPDAMPRRDKPDRCRSR
jgi:hypothetical protein